jgi:transcriptional regulator with GAF, ATPase, and Fis domain
MAHGGTIFLDEIGEMPLFLQPKLLRVLQSGEFERIGGQQTIKVDVRVISATNRDLMQEIMDGKFREDLFYRLNVFPITIPALRNRKEDIPLLVNHFIHRFARAFNSQVENISRADLQRLMEYSWPGNIRELMNLVERSIISSPGSTLRIDWQQRNGHGESPGTSKSQTLAIKDLERVHIIKVLQECGWRINGQGGAAEKLGLNPNTLRSRMKKLNISRE